MGEQDKQREEGALGSDGKAAPAGWYQDPEHAGSQRFWDGTKWTESRAPLTQGQIQTGRNPANDGLATAGYLMAILLPIIGVIIAIVLYARGDNRGTPVLLTAIVAVFVFLALFGT